MEELIKLLNALNLAVLKRFSKQNEDGVIAPFPEELVRIQYLAAEIFAKLHGDNDAQKRAIAFESVIPEGLPLDQELPEKIDTVFEIFSYYFLNDENVIEHKKLKSFVESLSISNPGKALCQLRETIAGKIKQSETANAILKNINSFALDELEKINANQSSQEDTDANFNKIKLLLKDLKKIIPIGLKTKDEISAFINSILPIDPSQYGENINAKLDLINKILHQDSTIDKDEIDTMDLDALEESIKLQPKKINEKFAIKYEKYIQAIIDAFKTGDLHKSLEALIDFANFLLNDSKDKNIQDFDKYLSGITAFKQLELPDLSLFTAFLAITQQQKVSLIEKKAKAVEEENQPILDRQIAALNPVILGLNAFASLMGHERLTNNAPRDEDLSQELLSATEVEVSNLIVSTGKVEILEATSAVYRNDLAKIIHKKLASNNLLLPDYDNSDEKTVVAANLAINAIQNQGSKEYREKIQKFAAEDSGFKLALDKYQIISQMHNDIKKSKINPDARIEKFVQTYEEHAKVLTKNPDNALIKFLKKIVSILPFVKFDPTIEKKLKSAIQQHGTFANRKAREHEEKASPKPRSRQN